MRSPQRVITLPDEIDEIDGVVADDVVDAAVVAWSARRVANGTALSLPDPPEQGDGRLGRDLALRRATRRPTRSRGRGMPSWRR